MALPIRAAGALALVALGLGAALGALPFSGYRAPAVSIALFAGVAVVVMARVGAYHPHRRLGLANALTLARAGGVAVFAGVAVDPGLLAMRGEWAWSALGAAVALLALDGADGWAARRQGVASAFGARLDMEVDALFILVMSALALALDKAGPWVLGLGLMRYAFVVSAWIWPALAQPLPSSLRRKGICVLQVAALTALLAPPIGPPLSEAVAAAAFAALAWSFGRDVCWLLAERRR